jgi:hypothetical protein
MEEWGYNDPYLNVTQQGLYFLDRPQVIKLTAIWQLPFGEGKKFGANSHGLAKKLMSGWEYNNFFVDPLSGFPAELPGVGTSGANAFPLKDPATTPGGPFTGNVDWKAYQVRAWNPCVLRQDNNTGVIAPTPQSISLGCGTDFSNNWGNYAWLETADYAPRLTPFRSGQIRRHHAFQWDMSILKRTKISERFSAQFGVEAFNVFNHNYFGRDQFSRDPNSADFGSIFPSQVSTQNMLPRQVQLRFKFYW